MASCYPSLKQQFENFAKFGDAKADGTTITLSLIDKWFKQAEVFTKTLTTTDTAITFNKLTTKVMTYEKFQKFIEDVANQKGIPADQIKDKLQTCGPPCMNKVTQPVKSRSVIRLTDTTLYTGSHRERFDEDGKGRGIEGREYIAEDTGYVTGYKGQGTYDSTH